MAAAPSELCDATPQPEPELTQEAQLRSGTYALLAALLRAPPTPDLLHRLSTIADSEAVDAIGQAWLALKAAAQTADLQTLDDEFHRLFIGIGRGALVPYGSWYQTGFTMERPLSELRNDLMALGFQRQSDVYEPEDHIAALYETMALLIQNPTQDPMVVQQFFSQHLAPWCCTFFNDLSQTTSIPFYQAVAQLGAAYMRLEQQYFEMNI